MLHVGTVWLVVGVLYAWIHTRYGPDCIGSPHIQHFVGWFGLCCIVLSLVTYVTFAIGFLWVQRGIVGLIVVCTGFWYGFVLSDMRMLLLTTWNRSSSSNSSWSSSVDSRFVPLLLVRTIAVGVCPSQVVVAFEGAFWFLTCAWVCLCVVLPVVLLCRKLAENEN